MNQSIRVLGACLGHPQRGLLAVGLVFARSASRVNWWAGRLV